MIPCLLLSAILIYLRLTSDKTVIYLTNHREDWIVGFESVPDLIVPEVEFRGNMLSFGLGFFRIDFLINKIEE